MSGRREARPVLERIMEKVTIDAVAGCWMWTGIMVGRVPQIRVDSKADGKRDGVQRVLFPGYPDSVEGRMVIRTCRNTRCVSPDHAVLATPAEEGARHRRWTQENIDSMRWMHERGMSWAAVGRVFGILGATACAYATHGYEEMRTRPRALSRKECVRRLVEARPRAIATNQRKAASKYGRLAEVAREAAT